MKTSRGKIDEVEMDGGEGGEEDEVKKGKERRGGKTDEAEK